MIIVLHMYRLCNFLKKKKFPETNLKKNSNIYKTKRFQSIGRTVAVPKNKRFYLLEN